MFPVIVQSMIELSRTQDEEVGDGTTSVIVLGICFIWHFFGIFALIFMMVSYIIIHVLNFSMLAGEMLHVAQAFIDKSYHPTVICRGDSLVLRACLLE